MTFSGPAGSPESDGAPPTRRQARALREAAAAPDATSVTRAHAHSAVPAVVEIAQPTAEVSPNVVPVPPVPVTLVLPDLAAVVESATTHTEIVVDQIALSRPETAPPGANLPELSVADPEASVPGSGQISVQMPAPEIVTPAAPLSRREARARAAEAAEALAPVPATPTDVPAPAASPTAVSAVVSAVVPSEASATIAVPAATAQPIATTLPADLVLPTDLVLPHTAAMPILVPPTAAARPRATPPAGAPRARVTAGAPRARPTAGASRVPASIARGGRRTPIAKMVTLLAIPALFLTAALPSYAFSPQGGAGGVSSQAAGDTQALTVASAAAAVSISADGFTATSQAELDDIEAGLLTTAAQQRAAEEARASAAEFAVYGIRAEGDDYPWPTAGTESQGGGLSPLGYYYRECVDFVAWRLNRDAGSTGSPWRWTWHSMTPGGGDGSSWAGAWAAKGWPTSKTPIVGAVATFSYNHVAYVQSVPGDGTVVLEEYNWMGSHAYHTRTVPIGDVPLYLYPPS